MLPLPELEALAERYRRDRDRRLMGLKASEVRDKLGRAGRALAQAADAVGDFMPHELALVGATKGEGFRCVEV